MFEIYAALKIPAGIEFKVDFTWDPKKDMPSVPSLGTLARAVIQEAKHTEIRTSEFEEVLERHLKNKRRSLGCGLRQNVNVKINSHGMDEVELSADFNFSFAFEDMKIRKPSSLHSFTKLSKKVFKGEQKFDISVPGEDKYETEFYHPVTTPLNQMGDFGLGVGLYFSTLRAMTVLMLLAGLMNIPNFLYFGSDEYSNSQEGVAWYLKGKLLS
jgi:hypothetical protein